MQIALGKGIGNFAGGNFLLAGENLTRSDFKHSKLFLCYNQHPVNIEHSLKSKLSGHMWWSSKK